MWLVLQLLNLQVSRVHVRAVRVGVTPTLQRMTLCVASHFGRNRALEVTVSAVTAIISAQHVMRMQFHMEILVVDAELAR